MMTPEQIARANDLRKGTLMETLGITYVDGGPGIFAATMPVNSTTHQPAGLLHGGATAALAESLGSAGSHLLIDDGSKAVVGIEVNVNHVKGVRSGTVKALGRLVHRGRSTHVWDIRVESEAGELVALCRLTNLIIDKRS